MLGLLKILKVNINIKSSRIIGVDVPDTSCHWYVASPDNTFGEGFDWEEAPWFDANGLNDVAQISKESVVEKLQNN